MVKYCVYAQGAYWPGIPAEPNRLSYSVPATHQGQLVTSLKAILYAPGSAIQTVTLQTGASAYVFAWRPLPPVALKGTVAMKDVSYAGFLHILAKEKGTGNLSALLVPAGSKTKIDTLKVASFYSPDLAFTICPANASPIHDRFGFAIRGSEEPCVP